MYGVDTDLSRPHFHTETMDGENYAITPYMTYCLTILGVKQSKFLASSRQQMGVVVRNRWCSLDRRLCC